VLIYFNIIISNYYSGSQLNTLLVRKAEVAPRCTYYLQLRGAAAEVADK